MTLPVFLHIEATPNPNQLAELQSYLSKVPAIISHYGGVPIATYDVERALDNQPSAKVFVVVSFPDRQAIDNFFAAPEYQAIIPLRDKGFSHLRFYITSERV
ncbi:DUF1330 domain-containing protein [Psychrobium sp. MM17-31]|uniref:DUF1330 domain-containing protein n=1 Tax=Psychrobium sp. MM17-31 TaxID=2917758 RepID=UPI001EF46464|nr:DUF1330 domain-containing protein [Psychrobium sp. MM17-31]MCG7532767.1 DUF1330 domain-containing protein [Psychrobium sp. MM17-31]